MRILHISDLHFGIACNDTEKMQRDSLLNELVNITSKKNIEFVIISGDIAYQNKDCGYEEAKLWLNQLSKQIGVDLDHFLLCPGNHDLDRNVCLEKEYISDRQKANNVLTFEHMDELGRRFSKYIKLCKDLGVATPKLNNKDNYLTGIYVYKDICFWVINTAWFAYSGGERDKGKLWIGQPLLDFLIHDYEEAKKEHPFQHVISIAHHPREWLHESDITSYNNDNKCAFDTLCEYSNVHLTGHTHGTIQEPMFKEKMCSFTTGASFVDVEYPHNFAIYDIDNGRITRYPYQSKDRIKWISCGRKKYKIAGCGTTSKSNYIQATNTRTITKGKRKKNLAEYLQSVEIASINMTPSDYENSKRIIVWPVIPRETINAIHLAELELIRLLSNKCGWHVLCLITELSINVEKSHVNRFIKNIRKYCEKSGIAVEFVSLNKDHALKFIGGQDKRSSKSSFYKEVLDIFDKIKVNEVRSINEKKYPEYIKIKKDEDKLLKHVRPLLQLAAIKTLYNGTAFVIVAGNDEHDQWLKFDSFCGDDFLSALLIPTIKTTNDEDVCQESEADWEAINIHSREAVMKHGTEGNVSEWYYKMFYCLPTQRVIKNVIEPNTKEEWDEIFRYIDSLRVR